MQTLKDWELIIVDDASTDETPSKIADWAKRDDRIRSIRLPESRKLPGALNEGFQHASGEFYTWTSDDNWYHPEAFDQMLAVLNARPAVGVVYADYTRVEENGSPLGLFSVGPLEDLARLNCIGACFLYRRQVHEILRGYDENMFLAEDYDFWLRASNQFQLEPLHELLYSYRMHEQSLTSRQGRAIALATEKALRRWLPSATWLDRDKRARGCLHWARLAFSQGADAIGRRYLLRAVLISRRPLLFSGDRSLLVDLLLGRRAGNRVRALTGRATRLFRTRSWRKSI